MNLRLYLRILRRFWVVVAAGFAFALVVAFLAMAKVSFANGFSVSYRQQETWQAATRLLITQKGFPWGRSVFPVSPTAGTPDSTSAGAQFADPSRFSTLAVIYAQLMNGDLIRRQMLGYRREGGFVGATVVTDPSTQGPLPLVDVTGQAHTPAEAIRISRIAAGLFTSYVEHRQALNNIPDDQRVLLQAVSTKPSLFAGRKKTLALVAFMAVLVATVGLTFLLENLRPAQDASELATASRPEPAEERNVA